MTDEREGQDDDKRYDKQRDKQREQRERCLFYEKRRNRVQRSYTYIMANYHNTVLYVGVTTDLKRRVLEHKEHKMEGFTDRYSCVKLVYYEEFGSVRQAIEREKQLKNWRRDWKFDLIRGLNPEMVDLWTM